ncbi:hypothetical protein D3C78_1892030 [compost metagenome]
MLASATMVSASVKLPSSMRPSARNCTVSTPALSFSRKAVTPVSAVLPLIAATTWPRRSSFEVAAVRSFKAMPLTVRPVTAAP